PSPRLFVYGRWLHAEFCILHDAQLRSGYCLRDLLAIRDRRVFAGVQLAIPIHQLRILLLQPPYEVIACTALEVHHIGADDAGAVIGGGCDGAFEERRLRRDARDDRCHQHTRVDTGVDELANRTQPLHRMRGARLERPPDVLVDAWHADVDTASASRGQVGKDVLVAHDHRALRHHARGVVEFAEHFEGATRDLVRAFDRLIAVGRGAHGGELTAPGRLRQLTPPDGDEVRLHEDDP